MRSLISRILDLEIQAANLSIASNLASLLPTVDDDVFFWMLCFINQCSEIFELCYLKKYATIAGWTNVASRRSISFE